MTVQIKGYKENIKRWNYFYNSDFYQYLDLNYPKYIADVFNGIYEDGDANDETLYQALAEKFNFTMPVKKYHLIDEVAGEEIKLSADVVCGYKQLMKYNPKFEDWIKDYEQIRQNVNLHFLWPGQGKPTINTKRYSAYKDRIDYLLFDLKCYFEGQETPMATAYENKTTKLWLTKFHGDFSYFIDEMQLNAFVDENYEVLDIETGQTKIITEKSEVKGEPTAYLQQLLLLNSQGKFD